MSWIHYKEEGLEDKMDNLFKFLEMTHKSTTGGKYDQYKRVCVGHFRAAI